MKVNVVVKMTVEPYIAMGSLSYLRAGTEDRGTTGRGHDTVLEVKFLLIKYLNQRMQSIQEHITLSTQ